MKRLGGRGVGAVRSASASCFSHVGLLLPVYGRLLMTATCLGSSKKLVFVAKVPGSQTKCSLHKIFKRHRGVGVRMTMKRPLTSPHLPRPWA